MGIFQYFSKEERIRRRLLRLLIPHDEERLFEIVFFGKKEEEQQRIAAKKTPKTGVMDLIFLVFSKGKLTHFSQSPPMNEKAYKELLQSLTKQYKKPRKKMWKRVEEALD